MLETMLILSDPLYCFPLLPVGPSEITKMRLQLLRRVRTVVIPHHVPYPGIAHGDL